MGLEGYSNAPKPDSGRLKRISEMIIPFGEHRDKRVDEVPIGYLQWIAREPAKSFIFKSVQFWVREYLKDPRIQKRIETEEKN